MPDLLDILKVKDSQGNWHAIPGLKGEKGDPAPRVRIIGHYNTLAALEAAVPDPNPGDAYFVGTTIPYDVYVYTENDSWLNTGPLSSDASGAIDDALDINSDNPVKNSAISTRMGLQRLKTVSQTLSSALNELFDAKAPVDHANTSTTYGKGTNTNYGHVKISDSLTDTTPAATGGTVPSMKAVSDLSGAINSLRTEKHVIVMGDSYSQTFTGWTGWIDQFKGITPFDVVAESPTGGSGFIGDPNIPNFETQLRNLTVANPDIVSDIIIMGGYNDISTDRTEAQLNTAIGSFATYANSRFKNAKIHFGLIAVDMRNTGNQQKINSYSSIFRRCCAQNGVAYITNSRYILLNMAYIFNVSGNANSGFHPNSDGTMLIARYLDEYLCSGYFDVVYGANYRGLNIYTFNGEVRAFPGFNTPANNNKVFYGAIAGTYAPDTWTTMSTFSATNIPCLWGTHSEYTTLTFYFPVFDNNGFKDFVLFRVFDKQLQIYSGSDGLTFSGSGYAKPTPFSAPLEACYG